MRRFLTGQRRISLSFLALALAIAAVLAVQSCQIRENGKTRTALCALRGDLEQRVASTTKYLDEHPGPEPFPGIPRKTLTDSLKNQQRTVDALSGLDCS
jgi:hypothetical protein